MRPMMAYSLGPRDADSGLVPGPEKVGNLVSPNSQSILCSPEEGQDSRNHLLMNRVPSPPAQPNQKASVRLLPWLVKRLQTFCLLTSALLCESAEQQHQAACISRWAMRWCNRTMGTLSMLIDFVILIRPLQRQHQHQHEHLRVHSNSLP
jgi:hypothetical protein